jgi:hypothetical protein
LSRRRRFNRRTIFFDLLVAIEDDLGHQQVLEVEILDFI